MLRPILALAATGTVAVLLWKLLAVTLLPLAGMAIGLVFLLVKVAFITCVVLFAVWLFRRMSRDRAGAAA